MYRQVLERVRGSAALEEDVFGYFDGAEPDSVACGPGKKKEFDTVVTRDYSEAVKTKTTKYTVAKSRPQMLRETAAVFGLGDIINVRSAKTHLSALLELAAAGHEITITSDGAPKAKLIGMKKAERRKTFQGMGGFLSRQPIHGGPPAEEIIREDRDSRGW